MPEVVTTTGQMQAWIDQLRAGDPSARDQLLNCCCNRLRQLTRKMLRRYPRVRRWEETDDVLQNVTLRLRRTLSQVSPATVRDFLRLASLNIRRELLDLARHYYGPLGIGTKHASDPGPTKASDSTMDAGRYADVRNEPTRLAAWTEFHEKIETLPEEEREVFDLLWYQGLGQQEAAGLLGIGERTLQRRWQSARVHLYEALGGALPPSD